MNITPEKIAELLSPDARVYEARMAMIHLLNVIKQCGEAFETTNYTYIGDRYVACLHADKVRLSRAAIQPYLQIVKEGK